MIKSGRIYRKYIRINKCLTQGNLTLPAGPCISESCIKIKINLNFYFHTSFWCRKRFYEGFGGPHKTFLRHHKVVEKSLIFSLRPGSGQEELMETSDVFILSSKLLLKSFKITHCYSAEKLRF